MDRRGRFRQDLSPLYLPIYDRLCSLAPPRWQPYCGVRTFREQALLFAQGRTTGGKKVTDAGPGTSPHNYGCASDWTLFDASGKPIWLDAHDPTWQEYADLVRASGGRWGITIAGGAIDAPHNELPISCSWHDVYDQYLLDGTDSAMKFIESKRSACE